MCHRRGCSFIIFDINFCSIIDIMRKTLSFVYSADLHYHPHEYKYALRCSSESELKCCRKSPNKQVRQALHLNRDLTIPTIKPQGILSQFSTLKVWSMQGSRMLKYYMFCPLGDIKVGPSKLETFLYLQEKWDEMFVKLYPLKASWLETI